MFFSDAYSNIILSLIVSEKEKFLQDIVFIDLGY
jgi:hypothetical protein